MSTVIDELYELRNSKYIQSDVTRYNALCESINLISRYLYLNKCYVNIHVPNIQFTDGDRNTLHNVLRNHRPLDPAVTILDVGKLCQTLNTISCSLTCIGYDEYISVESKATRSDYESLFSAVSLLHAMLQTNIIRTRPQAQQFIMSFCAFKDRIQKLHTEIM